MPSLKIIVLIRNPVDRIYSGYWQRCTGRLAAKQGCSPEDFAQKIRVALGKTTLEQEGHGGNLLMKDEIEVFQRDIRHGHYAEHLERWIQAFPPSQIMILFAEQFKEHPQAYVHAIESFLALPSGLRQVGAMDRETRRFVLPNGYFSGFNTTKLPRTTPMKSHHHKYHPIKINGYFALGDFSKATHPTHTVKMDAETRALLQEYYDPLNLRLLELIQNVGFVRKPIEPLPAQYLPFGFRPPHWLRDYPTYHDM